MRILTKTVLLAALSVMLSSASLSKTPTQGAGEKPTVAIESGQDESMPTAPCGASTENRRSDTCAQWKAADAAADSARSAWVFGIAGATIGLLTLLAAIAAAIAARQAAVHTAAGALEAKRSVTVGEAALAQSKEAAQSQLRAWLTVELELLSRARPSASANIDVQISIKNLGPTPANRVSVSVEPRVEKSFVINYGTLPTPSPTPDPFGPIMPGQCTDQKYGLRVPNEWIVQAQAAAAQAGCEPMIVVDAIVYYHTIFDAEGEPKRMTSARYCLTLGGNRNDRNGKARLAWLEPNGPFGTAPIHFALNKSAPNLLT